MVGTNQQSTLTQLIFYKKGLKRTRKSILKKVVKIKKYLCFMLAKMKGIH